MCNIDDDLIKKSYEVINEAEKMIQEELDIVQSDQFELGSFKKLLLDHAKRMKEINDVDLMFACNAYMILISFDYYDYKNKITSWLRNMQGILNLRKMLLSQYAKQNNNKENVDDIQGSE